MLYIIHIRHWTDLMIFFPLLCQRKLRWTWLDSSHIKKTPQIQNAHNNVKKNKLHFLISVINTRGRSVFCTLLLFFLITVLKDEIIWAVSFKSLIGLLKDAILTRLPAIWIFIINTLTKTPYLLEKFFLLRSM